MKTDVQIAQETKMLPISEIGESIGISGDDLEQYGKYKAKISLSVLSRLKDKKNGKLILVTAINPTPAGEGKTTTNIGLAMALNKIGKRAISTLREPSLGPCFGIKGGAAGGGYAQVVPMDDINLHFTGDFHAVTSAHNLLAALLDNHIHQGNKLGIDVRSIVWRRVMDMNERALRQIVIGLGPKANGVVRDSGFDITTSSEIMAALCLTTGLDNLKKRMGSVIVAYNYKGEPVTAGALSAAGAMTLLLKDAIKPNLVQTVENTPAIIHGGPFANIAHGCNSVLATKTALKLADYVVTEAGFGADLGAEKFFDIKCRQAGLLPDCTVIVATARALKYHGGAALTELSSENTDALKSGAANLERHIDNMKKFGVPVIVAINRFPSDTRAELALIEEICAKKGVGVALSDVWAKGGVGGVELAEAVVEICGKRRASFRPIYETELDIERKIEIIARDIYGADGVTFTQAAKSQIESLTRLNLHKMPVCMAKTQYSFSDNPGLLGAPEGFSITVREVKASTGAGFIVALTGDIMTMPGLPGAPVANGMNIREDGTITGLS